ncbi:MAG: NACHT domain-containing protein [Pseudonocardia sp.]|nr:NACHT domain-containing protein [Pseudonocardia sp.]
MSADALDRARVAELIVTGAEGRRRGSGYRVSAGAVLTAAHVVEAARSVQLRFEPDLPGEWMTASVSWWADSDSDLAVVLIDEREGEPALAPVRYGRLGEHAEVLAVQAVGFPWWKMRSDPGGGTRYRDVCHAVGRANVLSNWREGTMEVVVSPAPAPRCEASPWEGMSGAALWVNDRIVGVISKHHPRDGLERLAAARLDRALNRLDPGRRAELVRLLSMHERLEEVTALSRPDEDFVATYREFMASALNRFDFFGVDLRGILRRHPFAAGYVPLELRRDPFDDAVVSAETLFDQVLCGRQRTLIRGVAGSGKSTLLRWFGVQAAQRIDANELPTVPFLLELGRFARVRLPHLSEMVAPILRDEMPTGWTQRMLAQGRVLLLLDGLDEIPAREREYVEHWVQDILDLERYSKTRCVVTTRPSTVAEQWWADPEILGFHRFDLQSMSWQSIEQYVHGWHEVARADQPANMVGVEVREELIRVERRLLTTLSNRPALRGMSANPLLCGLLCALHLASGEYLPENRKQIYDEAVNLLLVRWPHLRRLRRAIRPSEPADVETAAETEPPLRAEELWKLFQRLAFWLVTERRLVLPTETALNRVRSSMAGLGSGNEDSPQMVLRYLPHQSGLLRELSDGSLEFIHRTFRDHLAAREMVEEEHLNLMLDNADKPHWHDVVVMAGAHARPVERRRILFELLERGRSDREHRDTLYLLAAAILEQASVLPPREQRAPDVRSMVRDAMAELIPPRTRTAAQWPCFKPIVLRHAGLWCSVW